MVSTQLGPLLEALEENELSCLCQCLEANQGERGIFQLNASQRAVLGVGILLHSDLRAQVQLAIKRQC